jgi:hypothetical protein
MSAPRLDPAAVAACYRYECAKAEIGIIAAHRLGYCADAQVAAGFDPNDPASDWRPLTAALHAAKRLRTGRAPCIYSGFADPCIGCTEPLD